MFSVLLPPNTVSMLEWTNNPSWTHCISLFPLLELLRVQVHLCSVRCRTSDISFRYERFCVHTSIGWIFSLYWRLLHQLYGFRRLLWFSFKVTSPPIWSDWCKYAARITCHLVSRMWQPRVVGGESSLKLSRMRKHSRYPAFTFSGVPVAKSNIIGVFPKCQDTEALSQFRGWILQGPHFSRRYVIRSQRAKKNCLILQFTGHLKVPVKNLKKSVQTDYQLWFSGG